jgi:hypothetical protein
MKRLSIFSCVLLFSLCFFELGSDGKMKKIRRSTFPVADAGNDQGDWRFQLPREGKTILIRNQRNGKILRKLTWNGEKFQDTSLRSG